MYFKLRLWLACAATCYMLSLYIVDANRAAAAVDFFEDFGPGWTDRWHYSVVNKYKGRVEMVQPPGFQDTAIKVSAIVATAPANNLPTTAPATAPANN